MYSRRGELATYTFEASGGLLNAGLVMQDRETDSYWSIMTERSIFGRAEGESLEVVPGAEKMTWGDWRRRHPRGRVLSVEGAEHEPASHFDPYFQSPEGYRKLAAQDERLATKELLYGFHADGKAWAVPHAAFAGRGAVFAVGKRELLLYREKDDSFYRSTSAFLAAPGAHFERSWGRWRLRRGDESASWERRSRSFGETPLAERLGGFDTFWYIWSLTNRDTELVGRALER